MKYILIFMLVVGMLFSTGCFVVPVEPEPEPEPEVTIICEGGHYQIFYAEWTPGGCGVIWYPAGTYWYNADGRTFLINNLVPAEVPGACPTSYVEEVFRGEE